MPDTHTVTITVEHRSHHSGPGSASVTITGDGSIEHMLDAFQAALVAAGFAPDTAARLRLSES